MIKTKIIATIGPKSLDSIVLKNMIKNGVNVLRLNFSHSDVSFLNNAFALISRVREELGVPLSIMVDTKGPEVRLNKFKENKVILKEKQKFILDNLKALGDENRVSISEPKILKSLTANTIILLNDGQVELKVINSKNNYAECVVVRGGEILNNKSVTVKNAKLNINYIDEIDEQFLKISLQNKCDIISASFVSTVEDINKIKNICKQKNHFPLIIAKIENGLGIENIDSILRSCDGIMIARGDLGCYYSYEQVPMLQQMLVEKAKQCGKICIVATEMLESMITSSRPTRAETSDIALATSQGVSAVMLSAETAVGANPALCIEVMAKIIAECEKSKAICFEPNDYGTDNTSVLSECSILASIKANAKAIVVYTDTGKSAVALSRCTPNVPVIAITKNKSTYQKLSIYYAVIPVLHTEKIKDINLSSVAIAKQLKLAKKGDKIITVTGTTDAMANLIKINYVL